MIIGTGVLQPGLQPRTGANPALDFGWKTRILQAWQDEEACQWQETNDMNTTEKKRRTDTGGTNN